jgi:hypothetical protein
MASRSEALRDFVMLNGVKHLARKWGVDIVAREKSYPLVRSFAVAQDDNLSSSFGLSERVLSLPRPAKRTIAEAPSQFS